MTNNWRLAIAVAWLGIAGVVYWYDYSSVVTLIAIVVSQLWLMSTEEAT